MKRFDCPTAILCLLAALFFTKNTVAQTTADSLLLRDFRPVSIYRTQQTAVPKARFPAIDVHAHQYAKTVAEAQKWVGTMDACGIQKSIIMTGETGAGFDSLMALYGRWPDRFAVWCGIDFRGSGQPDWAEKACRELERCQKLGASGVGEITDKGRGLYAATDHSLPPCEMHPDDPKMAPVWQKIAALGLPVNVHIAEPKRILSPYFSKKRAIYRGIVAISE